MWAAFAGLLVLAASPVTQVPQTPAPAPTPLSPEQEARWIAGASTRGAMLYAFDRAAWVSSDALIAKVPKDQLAGVGGYVVEPIDGTILRVTYFRGATPDATAFFVADVAGGKVKRSELLTQRVPLTPAQTMLVRAREVAAQTARDKSYRPCTTQPFNTVVLPSAPGQPIAVYLLTPQPDATTYPAGGHYRVTVSNDGKMLSSRPFSVTCLNLKVPKLPPGAQPMGLVVSHLLDPVPTEIHVFTSYAARMPLFVPTSDKRIWQVRGSDIRLSTTKAGKK